MDTAPNQESLHAVEARVHAEGGCGGAAWSSRETRACPQSAQLGGAEHPCRVSNIVLGTSSSTVTVSKCKPQLWLAARQPAKASGHSAARASSKWTLPVNLGHRQGLLPMPAMHSQFVRCGWKRSATSTLSAAHTALIAQAGCIWKAEQPSPRFLLWGAPLLHLLNRIVAAEGEGGIASWDLKIAQATACN